MNHARLYQAARLLSGRFTPFLVPAWTQEEHAAVRLWMAGGSFPDAPDGLRSVVSSLYEGRPVRLFNYGRTALLAALEALRLPAGSEVVLPSFGCTGTVLPVLAAGLAPVYADIDGHFNLSLDGLTAAYGPAVRAVILPHLSGCRARDTDRIIAWAAERNVYVIEDCAQSLGLEHNGNPTGLAGDLAVFSCHGGKPVPAPGGGWIVVNNDDLAAAVLGRPLPSESRDAVRSRVDGFMKAFTAPPVKRGMSLALRALASRIPGRGSSDRPLDPQPGRISDIEALLIAGQLRRIGSLVDERRRNAALWRDALGPACTAGLRFPPTTDNIFAKMLLSFEGKDAERLSARLRRTLWENGIECESSYTPLHLRNGFGGFRRPPLPVTERLWSTAFSVPVRPGLSDTDRIRIRRAAARFLRENDHD